MNRAERPDRAGSETPAHDAVQQSLFADDAFHATARGLNGARFDPRPEPSLVEPVSESKRPADVPAATVPAASPNRPAPFGLPIRIVGTPPPPDLARDPADVVLRGLPIAGVNRRRMAWIVGLAISVWVVAVFARQVGEASAAGDRAAQVRADNAALGAQVAALQQERDTVQQQSFIEFQARSFGLGTAAEKRFTLAPNAPPLPSNAPGSASMTLAPEPTLQTPLDSWLSLLFGPTH